MEHEDLKASREWWTARDEIKDLVGGEPQAVAHCYGGFIIAFVSGMLVLLVSGFETDAFSGQLALVGLIGGGVGYLVWRERQKNYERMVAHRCRELMASRRSDRAKGAPLPGSPNAG